MKRTPSKLHDHIGYWLRRLSDAVHDSFKAKLEQTGTSIPEWCVLIVLYHSPDTTPAQIADEIGIDRAAISRTVEHLCQNEMIVRQAGKDRRQTHLLLTEASKQLVEQLAQLADLNDAEFFSILTKQESKLFKCLVLKLFNHYQTKKETL